MMIVHIFLISVLFVLSQAFIGDRTRTRSNIFSPHSNFNQLHFSHEQSVDDGNIPSSITSTVLRQVYPGMVSLALIYSLILFRYKKYDVCDLLAMMKHLTQYGNPNIPLGSMDGMYAT
jgi:hypothetical protein